MSRSRDKKVRFPPSSRQQSMLINIANKDTRLTGSARRVFNLLLDRHNPDIGRVWPSQVGMAADLGLSERTIRNATALLIEAGYIYREWNGGPNGKCRYFFNLKKLNYGFADFATSLGSRPDRGSEPAIRGSEKRQAPAAEYHRELINKPEAENTGKAANSAQATERKEDKKRRINSQKQTIEKKLADRVGDDGWGVLMGLPDGVVDELVNAILRKERTYADTVIAIRHGYGRPG